MSHFDKIAKDYEESWTFSDDYIAWLDQLILNSLSFSETDKFTDIGGGTGRFVRAAMNNVKFITKPVCVEPSSKMAELATDSGIADVFCEDAHSYFQRENTFTKVLFKEVIHHIQNRKALWRKVKKNLAGQGKVLIVTRPKAIDFPLFKDAETTFAQNQPDSQDLMNELIGEGFHVEKTTHSYSVILPKAKWISMVESRFMSDLAGFDESELALGIKEIESKYKHDELTFDDKLVFISATLGLI